MPVTVIVDPVASVDRTFTLETAETGTGAGHADGTDTIGTDYVQGPWSVTIPAGATSTVQHIYIGTDGYDAFAGAAVSEGVETFTVRINAGSLHSAMKTGATASATARIIDVRVVPTTWDLLPTGLTAGDRFRLAFVTSDTTGSATDIATYNTHVKNNVDETGGIAAGTHTRVKEIGGLFFSAAASTAMVDAIDNTGMRFKPGGMGGSELGRPVYWLDGDQLATDYQDFYSGAWVNTRGNPRNGTADLANWDAWTGTYHAAMTSQSNSTSGKKSANPLGSSTPTKWERVDGTTAAGAVDTGTSSNSGLKRLLAVSQVFIVAGGTPTVNIVPIKTRYTEGEQVQMTVYAWPAFASGATLPKVQVTDSGSIAAVGLDASGTGLRTFSSLSHARALRVETVDDSTAEDNTVLTAEIEANAAHFAIGPLSGAKITLIDNDRPAVSISGGNAVTEGSNATFTLTASPAPTSSITVNVNVVDSGIFATSGQTGARTVSITTTGMATFNVGTDGDSVDEPNGFITATVNTGTGYNVGETKTASVMVNDDDGAAPPVVPPVMNTSGYTIAQTAPAAGTVELSQDRYFGYEGDDMVIGVNVGTAAGGALTFTVNLDFVDPEAALYASTWDVGERSFKVIVAAGETSGTANLELVADDYIEGPEQFTIELDTANLPAGVTAGTVTSSPGFIVDVQSVPADWAFTPVGVTEPGDRFRLQWLTASNVEGTAATLRTYQGKVANQLNSPTAHAELQALGSVNGSERFFRVLVSARTPATEAIDHTGTHYTVGGSGDEKGYPIYWLDGRKAADDYEDYYDGS